MEKEPNSRSHSQQITKPFGTMTDGNDVSVTTLANKNGMAMSVMNYGAAITSLLIPISISETIDVILGFENVEDYIDSFQLESPPYHGAVAGQFAGRINNGAFDLNGKKIQLYKNHGSHHLHGGNIGLSQVFWSVAHIETGDNPSITLKYTGAAEAENYPGKLTVQVTYTLTETNELKVAFEARSTEDTIINLTQHSYFNLDGHAQGLGNQLMQVNANQVLEIDPENIPTGVIKDVENTKFDFRKEKKCPHSIDNTFVIADKNAAAAILQSEKTRLQLSVFTSQPAVHIYVGGNCFGKISGKENADYHTYSGICFETQNFPDAPNHGHFPTAILKKDDLYSHKTTFKFEMH